MIAAIKNQNASKESELQGPEKFTPYGEETNPVNKMPLNGRTLRSLKGLVTK